jgi:IMP dehydrogenase
MLGNLLAGTDEAPGRLTTWNGRKVKLYRGMASFAAYDDKTRGSNNKETENFTAEGIDQAFVPYKGPVRDLLLSWQGGIKSGLSYCGAKNIKELWQKAEFIKISQASLRENAPHDVEQA